ncbi:Hsp20/alpha crystallin family protein [Methanofollis aquaemaris]|uniref:Hsp20/alpha crystallin family protein n=1 Tax=Methanofollis aquaemaris TaxID=126734 RepID=A0A8A3S6N2_9EURY|nr:Hsp20/alpha crystallin family protein [Methanofollis aquaemaris]QSZ67304.1 Hsp20/alpha crystallin family protein [Methanofollis aquaemaris]
MYSEIPDEDFQQLNEYIRRMVCRAMAEGTGRSIAFRVDLMIQGGRCHVLPPVWSQISGGDVVEDDENQNEPWVEVQETERQYLVTAEIPGMQEEEIRVWQEGSVLHIDAANHGRQYSKQVDLPSFDLEVEWMTYRNGVLEVVFGPTQDDEGPAGCQG